MSRRLRLPAFLLTTAAAAIAVGTAGVAIVGPALASTPQRTAPRSPATPGSAGRPALIVAPIASGIRLSPAAAGKATSTCVFYAAKAGWPNNGYFGGDLVTAATICVAESGGNPALYVCDKNNQPIGHGNFVPGKPVKCPAGTTSYDRGLWQLNSVAAKSVSNKCAFDPMCNAGQAYLFSNRGISFDPWSSYDQATYAPPFLDLVQGAVTRHLSGTVTSALLGECLGQGKAVAGASVVIANCGSGAASQLWSFAGGKLKAGQRCAATSVSGRKTVVVLRSCAKQKSQTWTEFGRFELRNSADGKCLTDPGSSLVSGTAVDVTSCANAKDQTWWQS